MSKGEGEPASDGKKFHIYIVKCGKQILKTYNQWTQTRVLSYNKNAGCLTQPYNIWTQRHGYIDIFLKKFMHI